MRFPLLNLRWCALLLALTTAGCATRGPAPPVAPAQSAAEISRTPFFPQDAYQCGPAALATLLGASGVEVAPKALVSEVYIPARKGSLQAEMLGAARKRGRVPVQLPTGPGAFEALAEALRADQPVLVMQNIGLKMLPAWHYAVVVGVDTSSQNVTLRSGTEPRLRTPFKAFAKSWAASDTWGVTLHPPDAPPPWAALEDWMQTVAVWSRTAPAAAAVAAEAATRRWPDHPAPWLAAGNARYADEDVAGAVQAFRHAQALRPSVGGAHNLAIILASNGCFDAADDALQAVDAAQARHPAMLSARDRVRSLSTQVAARDCPF